MKFAAFLAIVLIWVLIGVNWVKTTERTQCKKDILRPNDALSNGIDALFDCWGKSYNKE
ncbi:hypothetical protein OQH61_03560 [Helicobacter sp. MIT 21-1697]|uniref:hypothetical protein n=1 Tax=Helicobacter sp. MIT 21-1697 TaxID=2993733 RepID=UPI00224A5E90|nr:hypothetical protein [Helicobacter sp. MIT 21-1697]MCX2716811.1 hypothetical protein [Helicobacter sp. MIT 21-1697]